MPVRPLIVLACLILTDAAVTSEAPTPAQLAETVAETHGLAAWSGTDTLAAHVVVEFGGKRVIDHDFTFRTTGSEARMDAADGTSVVYDGAEASVSPAGADDSKARFHVLTWPWFIRAPFTVQEPWQQLGPVEPAEQIGGPHWCSRQTFDAGTGDTPDDWYDLLVDPETGRLEAMRYIVTYGKDPSAAQDQVSLIEYHDYVEVDGCLLSTRWSLWHLDPATMTKRDAEPKATATVSDLRFITAPEGWYQPADDAKPLPLPKVDGD